MLAAYLFSLIVGGGLVTFSLIAGGKDKSIDADSDGDVAAGHGTDGHAGGHDHDHDKAHVSAGDAALAVTGPKALEKARPRKKHPSILKNSRFWTYFTAFGGLTGAAVTGLHMAGEPVTGLLALGLGVAAGTGATVAQRVIGKEGVGGLPTAADYRGLEGVVLIPVAKGDDGKIRLKVGGTAIDLRAITEEDKPFAVRAPAFVLDVTADGTARIIHPPGRDDPA